MRTVRFFLLVIVVFIALSGNAQNVSKVEKHPLTVVGKKKVHPIKKKLYHPVWGPRLTYKNRWVYFPRYNFYWDNFHNVYIIKRGKAWVVLKTKPKEIERLDLTKEKSFELSEEYNETSAAQEKNDEHQEKYKVQ